MFRFSFLVFAATLLSLFGCATFNAQNCTENAGYEKGMNDAKMGRLMNMNQFTIICSKEGVELAQKGYRAGYDTGKNGQGSSQLNVTFENGKLGLVGAYNCQIFYQNKSFSERASTETEARNAVLRKCRQQFASCSENAITCSK